MRAKRVGLPLLERKMVVEDRTSHRYGRERRERKRDRTIRAFADKKMRWCEAVNKKSPVRKGRDFGAF